MSQRASKSTRAGSAWRTWEELGERAPRGPIATWMNHSGSMTAALRAHCSERFDLRVHLEVTAAFDEHQIGELYAREGLLREVVMSCDSVPWVFAQTLMPAATVSANEWLGRLGEQPLGDALFQRSDVTRSPFLFARIVPGTALHTRVAPLLRAWDGMLWARRSYFKIAEHSLLVNEVFLPGLATCPAT